MDQEIKQGTENDVKLLRARVRFFNGENLVGWNIMEHLANPTWPSNFDFFDASVSSESKMNAAIARRRIACGGRDFVPLRFAVNGDDVDLRSDSHAVTLRSNQRQQDPVVRRLRDVVKQFH